MNSKVKSLLIETFQKTIEYSTIVGVNAPAVLSGDPTLQTIAPVLTATVQDTFSDLINRDLSDREAKRVTEAGILTIQKIEDCLKQGKEPRKDLFFDRRTLIKIDESRTVAEELFEGTLLKCKKEHEEKKQVFIVNLFVHLIFNPEYSEITGNQFLSLIDRMTYSQFCILSLVKKKDSFRANLRKGDYSDGDSRTNGATLSETINVLQQIFDLYSLGILAQIGKEEDHEVYDALLGWGDIIPNQLTLTPLGEGFFNILGLEDIPGEDIKHLIRFLC